MNGSPRGKKGSPATEQRFPTSVQDPPAIEQLYLQYPGDDSGDVAYRIKFDTTLEKNIVIRDAPSTSLHSLIDLWTGEQVYAGDHLQLQIDVAKPDVASQFASNGNQGKQIVTIGPFDESSPYTLQRDDAPVGLKLFILRSLMSRQRSLMLQQSGDWLVNGGTQEPLLITLIDLTRYGDEELAYYATQYLRQINVSEVVVRLLRNPSTAEVGKQAFMHLDEASCQIVLSWLQTSDPPLYKSLVQVGNPLQLAATPSLRGDRYYVQATWDPKDQQTVACLSKAFSAELMSGRSLEAETALMQNIGFRFVYWYDKGWVVHIRDEIIGCGGSANFLVPTTIFGATG